MKNEEEEKICENRKILRKEKKIMKKIRQRRKKKMKKRKERQEEIQKEWQGERRVFYKCLLIYTRHTVISCRGFFDIKCGTII